MSAGGGAGEGEGAGGAGGGGSGGKRLAGNLLNYVVEVSNGKVRHGSLPVYGHLYRYKMFAGQGP